MVEVRKQRSSMETIQLSHKEFLKIDKDYSRAAKVADLRYVSDQLKGIQRQKKREWLRVYI